MKRGHLGRLTDKFSTKGIMIYGYDGLDNLTEIQFEDTTGHRDALKLTFDALGQFVAEHSADGVFRHHYDELGNPTRTQLFDGRWINRLYYGSGHLHQLNLDGQVINDYERDRLHREVLRTQGVLHTRNESTAKDACATASADLPASPLITRALSTTLRIRATQ